ncbi:MAG: hypothetical protein J7513_01925 [Solirubrobacteraceae bacterium]|nr:hypothetical protein [Solirubrobacteraceae bacterium]
MTYDPAGEPLDPARGEQIVARAEGVAIAEAQRAPQPARPVERRAGLPAPVKAAAIGGVGVAAGLVLAALVGRGNGRRVIVAPAPGRRKRRLRAKETTSVLVDFHVLER